MKKKEYIEKTNGCLQHAGMNIPRTRSNKHYKEFLELKEKGQVNIITEKVDVWQSVNTKRQNILTKTDWTQLPDSGLSPTKKLQWKTYRQRIRDLTKTFNKPENVVWPRRPSV